MRQKLKLMETRGRQDLHARGLGLGLGLWPSQRVVVQSTRASLQPSNPACVCRLTGAEGGVGEAVRSP
jgi:hypothetical protein